jgi:hypothetical protein
MLTIFTFQDLTNSIASTTIAVIPAKDYKGKLISNLITASSLAVACAILIPSKLLTSTGFSCKIFFYSIFLLGGPL